MMKLLFIYLMLWQAPAAMADVCATNDDDKYSWCFFQWHQATPQDIDTFLDKHNIGDINKNLDIKENKVIHRLSGNPNTAVFVSLTKKGADVNAKNRHGQTPLHLAAVNNQNPAVLAFLINAGAKINEQDATGNTPLHWAATGNANPIILALLLQAGADISSTDKSGRSPLQAAKDSIYQENKKEIIAVWERHGEIAEKSFAAAAKILKKFSKNHSSQ